MQQEEVNYVLQLGVFGALGLYLVFMVPGAIDAMLLGVCMALPVLLLLAGCGLISASTVELIASLRDSKQREKVRAAVNERFSN